jgi:hypothetical protein
MDKIDMESGRKMERKVLGYQPSVWNFPSMKPLREIVPAMMRSSYRSEELIVVRAALGERYAIHFNGD